MAISYTHFAVKEYLHWYILPDHLHCGPSCNVISHLSYTRNCVQTPAANSLTSLSLKRPVCKMEGIPTVPASSSYSKDQTSQGELHENGPWIYCR